jgi:hypothetical protein
VRHRAIATLALIATSIAWTLAGCAPHIPPAVADAPETTDTTGTTIVQIEIPEVQRSDATLAIDNRGTIDITISVLHDGLKERLIRSIAARRDSVYIPARIVGLANSIRLIAETAGARSGTQATFTTETVVLRPGMRLLWTIESDLQRSHLGIY